MHIFSKPEYPRGLFPSPAFNTDESAAAAPPLDPPADEPAEEQTTPDTPPQAPPAPAATIPVSTFQQRVDELTALRYEEKRRADALQQEVIRLQAQSQTQQPAAPVTPQSLAPDIAAEVINRQAQLRAQEMAPAIAAEIAATEAFNNQCNAVAEAGKATFGADQFQASIAMLNNLGTMSKGFVEAALETGEGAKIIYELGKNADLALAISKMSPVKQAVALAKMAAAPVSALPVSGAPAPITPTVLGAIPKAPTPSLNDPALDMAAWMAARNKQVGKKK